MDMPNVWMKRGGYAVGKYQGFEIYRDEEEGLYWQEDGFFSCFKDVWDSIDDYNADNADELPLDTPCLDNSFHQHEMDLD
jgi:hypothetical protein